MTKLALITGITGQDGSYLAELLLQKHYKVYGIVRRTSLLFSTPRIDHIRNTIHLEYGDMTDGSSLSNLLHKIIHENTESFEIFEIYNLAAQSHVKISFDTPEYTSLVDGIGTLKILEFIRCLPLHTQKKIKFYQAGTSEMCGDVTESPQNENTQFKPISPYAAAKLYSHNIVSIYRKAYNIFACNGILFNHESPRRGPNFVTMKIINCIKNKQLLTLGNIYSTRDWGHAKDYVYGIWLMLQHSEPDDYILATGNSCSIKHFVEQCFLKQNIIVDWSGSGIHEKGYCSVSKQLLVDIDQKYFRPCEVNNLLGDSTKAKTILNWSPSFTLDSLIDDMFQ